LSRFTLYAEKVKLLLLYEDGIRPIEIHTISYLIHSLNKNINVLLH